MPKPAKSDAVEPETTDEPTVMNETRTEHSQHIKLSASTPAFVPAYVNPLRSGSKLSAGSKPFVPTPPPKSLLAEELGLDMPAHTPRQTSALANICNSLSANIASGTNPLQRTGPTRAQQRESRHSRGTPAAATKRPAAKRANAPSKRARLDVTLDVPALPGLPFTRSGCSNLLDELDLGIVSH